MTGRTQLELVEPERPKPDPADRISDPEARRIWKEKVRRKIADDDYAPFGCWEPS